MHCVRKISRRTDFRRIHGTVSPAIIVSLNLGGSAVSVEAAVEFQKVMPQCRVNR